MQSSARVQVYKGYVPIQTPKLKGFATLCGSYVYGSISIMTILPAWTLWIKRIFPTLFLLTLLAHGGTSRSAFTGNHNVKSGTSVEGFDDGGQIARVKRTEECPKSPPGLAGQCIPCLHDELASTNTFEHTDKYSNTCICDLCMETQYLNESTIICKADGECMRECVFTILGETFMNSRNNCSIPFNCTKKCPGNMVIVIECTQGKDSTCGCADGFYQTGETACEEEPTCPVNHELQIDQSPDEKYTSHTCVPCPDGYVQPKDNSRDKCHPVPSQKTTAKTVPRQPDQTGHTTDTDKDISESTTTKTTGQNVQKDDDHCLNLSRSGAIALLTLVPILTIFLFGAIIYIVLLKRSLTNERHLANERHRVNYNNNGHAGQGREAASIQPMLENG